MTLWQNRSNLNIKDTKIERINYGTLGNDQVIPGTVDSRRFKSIVDDQDPNITYELTDGTPASVTELTIAKGVLNANSGTYSVIGGESGTGTPLMSARYSFRGKSIGVYGMTNTRSGLMRVYIDDVLTPGRMWPSVVAAGATYAPVVSPGDTTINILGDQTFFPTAGTLKMGNELITYTGKGVGTFTGCTVTEHHYAKETIYLWDSEVDLSATTPKFSKKLLYFRDDLDDVEHEIRIVTDAGTTGNSRIYFDGFATGSILGDANISTQIGTIIIENITTDANGYATIGPVAMYTNDLAIVGIIGYSQTNTEVSSTDKLGTLGCTLAAGNEPSYYISGADPAATFDVRLTFAFIGEAV